LSQGLDLIDRERRVHEAIIERAGKEGVLSLWVRAKASTHDTASVSRVNT
jgi:hypothetical protein